MAELAEAILDIPDQDIERASNSLKALSHPIRLKILCILSGGEACVQDVVSRIGTSQSNISQHLAIMRDKGILASHKEANRVMYGIADAQMLKLFRMMHDILCGDN